jgi:hypothetical protein
MSSAKRMVGSEFDWRQAPVGIYKLSMHGCAGPAADRPVLWPYTVTALLADDDDALAMASNSLLHGKW